MPFSDQRQQFTHEAIRKRMTEHIMHLWGVKNPNTLDPFVRLVMDTLANELHKISHEYLSSEAGLLTRLAGLLTPALFTMPRAAHALVQVQPADPVAYMASTESLFLSKRFASKPFGELDTRHDIFLGAVDTVKLFRGRVAWLAAGSGLHTTDAQLGKQLHSRALPGRQLPAHALWLGLDLHADVPSLDRLGFYLELPDMPAPGALLNLLPLSRWSLNGEALDARPGLCYEPEPDRFDHGEDLPDPLLTDLDLNQQVEQDVKNIYHNRFMHLRQPGRPSLPAQTQAYPEAFSACFPETVLANLAKQPTLWIRVDLPAQYGEQVLDQLNVRLNVLPVMNRRLHRLMYRARVMQNILPLPVGPRETFMAVRSLIDSHHRVFNTYPLRNPDHLTPGHYTVRRSGIERFDARDAQEQLHYLLEILRDESVAFSAYGHDTVQLAAQQLNEQIRHLEQLLQQQEGVARELPHYLLVNPYEKFDTLEASYWTTDCEDGNNILAGTHLQSYDIAYLLNEETMLLTTTTGGQNRPQLANQLAAYRYALMSRDRLVTNEDIRSFAQLELGGLISAVHISKGVTGSGSTKQGFVRTIDVCLTPAPTSQLNDAEWEQLCESLLTKLHSRSGQVAHYRVLRTAPA